MRKSSLLVVLLMCGSLMTGCAYLASDGTELGEVAREHGMINITTGDGTFENYTAVDYHSGCEIGIGVGLPFIGKFMELWPAQSNEDLMSNVAAECEADGANAMINVDPVTESYWGFPFFIVGLYVDSASGTGIKVK